MDKGDDLSLADPKFDAVHRALSWTHGLLLCIDKAEGKNADQENQP